MLPAYQLKYIQTETRKKKKSTWVCFIYTLKAQETYREKEKDRAIAIKLLCFSISSIKFSVSKGCAGPNTIFNTFMNIIFTEGLDDKELSLLIIY